MAKKLKEILTEFLEGKNFEEINDTITVETMWKKIVGEPINNNTKIISYKKEVITIKTSTPVWRNELSIQKKDILTKIH